MSKSTLKRLTDAHRLFARYLAAGARQSDAYRAAGFGTPTAKPNWLSKDASRLANDPLIKELRAKTEAEARLRLDVTVDRLVLQAEEARLLAMRLEKPADAVQAVLAIGKLTGLIHDWKTEVNLNLIPKPAFLPGTSPEMDLAEWERQWAPKEIELKPSAPGAVNGNGKNGHG